MSVNVARRLVDEYMRRLETSSRSLPPRERDELLGDIRSHIATGLEEAGTSEAAVRNLLDSLGTPEDVAAAAGAPRAASQSRGRHLATVLLLLCGGLVGPPIGWLVGVVLLWTADVWSRPNKWLGTLVWPGGIALPLALCLPAVLAWGLTPWLGLPLLVVVLVPPVLVAIYLYKAATE